MKKIYFFACMAAALTLFTACDDYNERNFPGYDEANNPANLANYTYTLTAADFTTIANSIKKPVNDSISAERAKFKIAKNRADSAVIEDEIKRLQLRLTTDPVYVAATEVANNRYFSAAWPAQTAIPHLLNQKYTLSDPKSSVKVTYDFADGGDTTAIAATHKYTLTDEDYTAMGTATNQPGQYKNFSAAIPTTFYLNAYLKTKNPYATVNDKRMVRYKYFNKVAVNQYRIMTYDGKDWKSDKTDQFLLTTGKKWVFDPTIYIVQVVNDRTKDANGLPGNMSNMYSVIVHNVWNNPDLNKYVSSFKNDEYYYGASAYQGNFSFQYSVREGTPYLDAALKALGTEDEKISFMFNRVNEAIIIYLKYAYPDAKPVTSEGLDQYFAVTFRVYERYMSGTSTNNYQAIFQCTSADPLEFKFIERKKL